MNVIHSSYQIRVSEGSKFDLAVRFVHGTKKTVLKMFVATRECKIFKPKTHIHVNLHRLFTGMGCLNLCCQEWCERSINCGAGKPFTIKMQDDFCLL